MRAGTALTQLVEFTDGFPDGDITWQLLDGAGAAVDDGTVTPVAASASAVIVVPGTDNLISGGALFDYRELNWSYSVGGVLLSGTLRYRLEAFLPLGVSAFGVRTKLGVESHELSDDAIDLVGAYVRFQDQVGAANLSAVTGNDTLLARDAIEALCGLRLIPSLQVSLAQKLSSGTDQFQRATKIDWETLRAQLESFLGEGVAAVNPNQDPAAAFTSLLVPVVRDDPVTGTTP